MSHGRRSGKLTWPQATLYWSGDWGAPESEGSGCPVETRGVMSSSASCAGKTGCSSSYPQAGQTNPSQQKYGTVKPHAGHAVVAMSHPPSPGIDSTSSMLLSACKSSRLPCCTWTIACRDECPDYHIDDMLVSSSVSSNSILAYQKRIERALPCQARERE
jgi:hypothetical protein